MPTLQLEAETALQCQNIAFHFQRLTTAIRTLPLETLQRTESYLEEQVLTSEGHIRAVQLETLRAVRLVIQWSRQSREELQSPAEFAPHCTGAISQIVHQLSTVSRS